jgi:DNA-binding transcriptional ArsR family regulator
MSMRLRLAELPAERVRFGCSPVHETLRSLHVLTGAARHPLHIDWARRTRAALSPELAAEIDAFGYWFGDRPLFFPRIWPLTGPGGFDRLAAAPVEDFAAPLRHGALVDGAGPLGGDPDVALRRVAAEHPPSVPVLRQLATDPAGCRERFGALLAGYWDACLAADWPDREAALRRDIAGRTRAIARHGLTAALAALSPYVHAEPGGVHIHPPGPPRPPLDLRPTALVLLPSHFAWPRLAAAAHRDRDGETVLITYAPAATLREAAVPAPPEDLLALLRAAADPTRLRILRLLASRPRPTDELAGLIGLTGAAISKHLKVLNGAGWLTTTRHGHYVYYQLREQAAGRLAGGLDGYLS